MAENNDRARARYDSLGFVGVDHFVYASRQAPTRLRGQSRRSVSVA